MDIVSNIGIKAVAKTSTNLFEDQSMFYVLLSLFVVLVIGGLVWQHYIYNPRITRTVGNKGL